ncbi:unnamed protein product [Echinostoma caproni]|uniref:Uncharacterized protein n=1 Tax=Echinostoma caproni TaxID=27848 RepID=A0A183A4E8_9TREM|nr:unnamed protein product [Echinostoma caproni]
MGHNNFGCMYQLTLCSTDAASRLDPCTGMEMVEAGHCYLVSMRHGVDPIESDIKKLDTATLLESAAGFSQLSRMKKIIATWLACATELSQLSRMKTDTDAASRLDPCTGMELVEEVDCYLVSMCHGVEPIESDENGIGYEEIKARWVRILIEVCTE